MRTFLLTLLLAAPAVAQRDARVPDPDPELERKTFVLPPGFEVNLFASDPLLAKPIQMNFDPAGRLWVVSSETYPQVKPGVAPDDKVLILEDTQGKGVADKTTIFARGLLIPTGVAPGYGGAYVAAGTELLHFSDPDPMTGVARKKRVVLSGFGTEDTHHLLHTLKWGPDGALYMNQSVYIHSHIETADGVKRLNAGGVWRFEPKTGKLEVYARGLWNPWGTAWDKWGRGFVTDGAGFTGINMLMRGAEYEAAYKLTRPLPGLNPGSPKLCGLAVLSGRHLPPEYDGSLVANDFRGHRVCRYVVTEDGAGFVSREQPELIKSGHPAFRPIDVCMGPDGAVYVADWYNPIIQHGEVDFRDPRRDRTHGRIWRITAKGRPLVERPKLAGADTDALVTALHAPEQWTREQALRVLDEQGVRAVREPGTFITRVNKTPESERRSRHRLPAVDQVRFGTLRALGLSDPDARVRAAWCRANESPGTARLVADPNPQVRLEAVRALGRVGTAEAAVAATAALDHPMDKWLDYALWLTLRELAPHWLPAVQAGTLDLGGDPKKLLFALQAVGSADVAGPLLRLHDTGKLTADQRAEVMRTLARHGGTAELGRVLAFYHPWTWSDAQDRLLAEVEAGARARKVPPPANAAEVLTTVAGAQSGPGRQAAARLIGLWKFSDCRRTLELVAADRMARDRSLAGRPPGSGKPATLDDRRAALDGLVLLGGPASVGYVAALADAGPVDVRAVAVVALLALDPERAAGAAAELFQHLTPDQTREVVSAFTQRPGGADRLALHMAHPFLPPEVARAGLRAANAAGPAGAKLAVAFTQLGRLSEHKWSFAGDDLTKFLAELPKADPARGEAIYRRGELQCLKCHAIAGAGGLVGPEMTSLGGSAQPDYILESLLVPNAKVKEGYNALAVATEDGRQVAGIKVRESDAELVLRDAEGKLVTLPKADIASRKDAPSLMPAGLVDGLTRQELLDLTRFLSELGKGSYAAKPGGVVRAWETVEAKPVFALLGRKGFGAVASEPGLAWSPVFARVSGDLSLDDLPRFWLNKAEPLAVARFAVERNTAGKLTLKLPDSTGLLLWVDGVPVAAGASVAVDVAAGSHVVTVGVELVKRTTPLQVEVE